MNPMSLKVKLPPNLLKQLPPTPVDEEDVMTSLGKSAAFKLRDGSFLGKVLQPGQAALGWMEIQAMIYVNRDG